MAEIEKAVSVLAAMDSTDLPECFGGGIGRHGDGQETDSTGKNVWSEESMGSIPSNPSRYRLMWGANPHPEQGFSVQHGG